jgi:DNA-binding response OmpR family regulator
MLILWRIIPVVIGRQNQIRKKHVKKIMIVDDDPGIRDILKIIFERGGYEVCLEADGKFIFQKDYPLPDIFLLDRYLSGMDGVDICRYLKSQEYSKHVPVIIISASPDLAHTAVKAGADGFIEKPFDLKNLLQVIEKHVTVKDA